MKQTKEKLPLISHKEAVKSIDPIRIFLSSDIAAKELKAALCPDSVLSKLPLLSQIFAVASLEVVIMYFPSLEYVTLFILDSCALIFHNNFPLIDSYTLR